MVGVGNDRSIGCSMEGTANVGCVLLDGDEGDGAQGRDEETNSTDVMRALEVVDDAPTSGSNVVFIVAEGDHWWSGGSIFEEMKL